MYLDATTVARAYRLPEFMYEFVSSTELIAWGQRRRADIADTLKLCIWNFEDIYVCTYLSVYVSRNVSGCICVFGCNDGCRRLQVARKHLRARK